MKDSVLRLALLLIKDVKLSDEDIIEAVMDVNNTDEFSVTIYVGGGIFNFDPDKDVINEFEDRIFDKNYEFKTTAEESLKIEDDEEGYFMYNVLDCFYDIKSKAIGMFDGGGCCPLTWVEFSEEKSGKTSVYKCIKKNVFES